MFRVLKRRIENNLTYTLIECRVCDDCLNNLKSKLAGTDTKTVIITASVNDSCPLCSEPSAYQLVNNPRHTAICYKCGHIERRSIKKDIDCPKCLEIFKQGRYQKPKLVWQNERAHYSKRKLSTVSNRLSIRDHNL